MHGMQQQTTPGCERACVPYANGMLHNASGARSRTLSAPVVPVVLALVPTLNTLGSPLAPKPVRPRLAAACPV